MRILVSACLLGVACRYDGKSKPHPAVLELQARHELIPVCGSGAVYDGSFTRTLTAGDGVTAELLRQHGIAVFGESRLADLASHLKGEETR